MCLLFPKSGTSQTTKLQASLFEGILLAGYTDHGAYINCTGPAVKYILKKASIMAGLLPSLKIKEDRVQAGAARNSLLTPTLGFGLTGCYKHLVVQLPAFYSAKTSTTDGKWKLGVGVGYKF
ncbi:hypothetical protein FAZ19_15450 [Sphingobacterium alkalisoli]|uniref:Outer membrane protein beta-barrel domain-containing protein n=1 Tax=Sphingobacterium alkalisoli TaxID=1874115 RepID=A0A4U0H339_9SPHI|nr:hypothetical protein FAZ19_15450 [Sphingobacterium alkalisoli]